MRRTGNGTSNRQWLYLYVNLPFICLVKIGISGDYRRRAREVSKAAFGWAIPVFAVKIPLAWQCEQFMHRCFCWANVRFGGSREWFLFPVAPFALAIMLVAFLIEWLIYILIALAATWFLAGQPKIF